MEILVSDEPDIKLDIPNGLIMIKNFISVKIKEYDGILLVSHFKGHAKGGYGGALKNLSIGLSSRIGKTYIHSAGKYGDPNEFLNKFCSVKDFKEFMVDYVYSMMNYYKGKMAFIIVMKNISVDCDGNTKPPCRKDIGILASINPNAVDKACLDIIYNSDDPRKKELIERNEDRMCPQYYRMQCEIWNW